MLAGRQSEDGVAVEHRVRRADRASEAVVGHISHLRHLGLRQRCRRRHHPDRRVQAGGLAGQFRPQAVAVAGGRFRQGRISNCSTASRWPDRSHCRWQLTTAMAPTWTLSAVGGSSPALFETAAAGMVTVPLAVPTPPWRPPARAPVPAPTAPHRRWRTRAAAIARRPNSASGRWSNRPPRPRSKTTAAGTTGTTPCRSSPAPTGNPNPRSSSQPTTP